MNYSYQKRLEKLNKTIKENNISYGILFQALKIKRSAVYPFIEQVNKGNLNKLVQLEKAVDKILKSDIYETFVRGHVAPKIERQNPNSIKLREFLKMNNISTREGANICGISSQYFNTLIAVNKRYDISTDIKDKIMNSIENYLKQKDQSSTNK